MKIEKIKNFEGYERKCRKCGKEIKHAYTIDGKGCYGSECVKEICGYGKGTDKKIKEANKRAKLINDVLNSKNGYKRETYDFMTDEQIINQINIHGRI